MMSESLPDNNTQINLRTFILDPLSVIIKLAVIGNKPVGTKILISKNIIYFQEPGPFQALCRMFFKTNKTDLQYMYNPIELACKQFLSKEFVKTETTGVMSVDSDNLTWYLINAVKELNAKIEAQALEIATLKGK